MQIAFWSNARGRAGTTSNLAALSIMLAMEGQQKSIIFENHINLNHLGHAFVKHRNHRFLCEENLYYLHMGTDNLLKRVHSNLENQKIIEDIVMEVIEKNVYYIPQSHAFHKDVFEYELNQIIRPLLTELKTFAPFVLIDTAGCENLSTKTILSESDLVVVNLTQEPYLIEDFFQHYQSICEKAVFLIGNYDRYSKFNQRNMIRQYSIPKEKIAVIPYNSEFRDAFISGTIIPFISRNYHCKRKDENYYFIHQLKKAAAMLIAQIQKKTELCCDFVS